MSAYLKRESGSVVPGLSHDLNRVWTTSVSELKSEYENSRQDSVLKSPSRAM